MTPPITLLEGDCRAVLAGMADESVHCVVTDPPYGETDFAWDVVPAGWLAALRRVLRRDGSAWIFGSLKSLLSLAGEGALAGWTVAQDIVWEKHNGSSARVDRFRRVHELALHLYRSDAPWGGVYRKTLYTHDAVARRVRRQAKPPQWRGGRLPMLEYVSEEGGPRLMRSVFCHPSMHGQAEHGTQKPVAILMPLIEHSCPPGGIVLDPFVGSGSTALAARALGMRCIGIEQDPTIIALARQRIAADVPLLGEIQAGAA